MPEAYEWVIVERKVKRKAAVEVSKSTHTVPRYMLRVGTPRTGDDGDIYISSRISIYSVGDAIDLLNELSEKYQSRREQDQEHFDSRFHASYRDDEAPPLRRYEPAEQPTVVRRTRGRAV